MTIREKGYFHWEGTLLQRKLPWWPIARLGIKLSFKRKYFKFVYFGSFLPAMAYLTGIYISERLEDFRTMIRGSPQLLQVNPAYFKSYFTGDFLLFMIVMILVVSAAGLISEDLKHNALQLYFSRPLQKKDYVLGKAAIVFFFLLSLTLMPGFLFIIFKLLFAGSFRFIVAYPWLPLSIISYSALVSLFFCFYALFLSSLSKNRTYVAVLIFAIYLFTDILSAFFFESFKNHAFALISLKVNIQQVGAFLFGQKPAHPLHWSLSFLILAAVCFPGAIILRRKVKGVEIVK